jgi:ribosome-binding protein aMBF1 (putative translation factor)
VSGHCEICGRLIVGRTDRLTCTPACKKARQRDIARNATANRPDPPKSGVQTDATEPRKGDTSGLGDPYVLDPVSSGRSAAKEVQR